MVSHLLSHPFQLLKGGYATTFPLPQWRIQGLEMEQAAPSGQLRVPQSCQAHRGWCQEENPHRGQSQELSMAVCSTHHPDTAPGSHGSWGCWLTVPSERSVIPRVFRAYLTALRRRTNASWQSQKWWKIWSLSQAKLFRNNVGGIAISLATGAVKINNDSVKRSDFLNVHLVLVRF